MKPDLSFFLGGIRPYNWVRLYESIAKAVTHPYEFELVICSPYPLPQELEKYKNIKLIRDFGSCSRAAQIAAINCEATLITLSADDGVYEVGSMNLALDEFSKMEGNITNRVLGLCYEEGGNQMYSKDWYWKLKNHDTMKFLPGIPDDCPMALNSIISKSLFMEIGGYDTKIFETCNWGGHDLMIRLWKRGVHFQEFRHKNLSVEWGPETPEHRPIYLADHPPEPTSNYRKFLELYIRPNNRIKINPFNWEDSEAIWSKRFK